MNITTNEIHYQIILQNCTAFTDFLQIFQVFIIFNVMLFYSIFLAHQIPENVNFLGDFYNYTCTMILVIFTSLNGHLGF